MEEEDKVTVEVQAAGEQDKDTKKVDSHNNDELTRKIIFSLCYIWGILFFLPLIMYKNDAKAMRHANEGLLLLILTAVGNVIFGILTIIGGIVGVIFRIVASLYSLALLALGIIGIVYVVTDRNEPLPLIGGISLIK